MIARTQDLIISTEEEFDCLPDDGVFEVVDGRVILLPGNKIPHQKINFALATAFARQLKTLAYGFVVQEVNVSVPPDPEGLGRVHNRVPDLVVSTHDPGDRFRPGQPPELVIEILSTRRGNVERTEKLDDYARGGIPEYWIVDWFARLIEVYLLQGDDYVLQEPTSPLRPRAFPGVEIDPREIWAAVE